MIARRTLLVLGAGASIPYGQLSGADLANQLSRFAGKKNSEIVAQLCQCGLTESHVMGFFDAFLRSRLSSIDAFLAKRTEFADAGKLAIAYLLGRRENPGSLFAADTSSDWYRYFWNQLVADLEAADKFQDAQLRVLTFNYDRSFEYFLFDATKHTFGLSSDEALKWSKAIKTVHVYGSLGDFDIVTRGSCRAFSPNMTLEELRIAADGIRVIPEARDSDQVFELSREWFKWAELTLFLGFGFDYLNCQRLGWSATFQAKTNSPGYTHPSVLATARLRTEGENDKARADLGIPFVTFDEDCLGLLRRIGGLR